MPAGYNHDRALFFPSSDMAAGIYTDRVRSVLSKKVFSSPQTINDAIEAHQCKLIIEGHPYFFQEKELPALQTASKELFALACKYIKAILEQQSVTDATEQVEFQYQSQFWHFLAKTSIWEEVPELDLHTLCSLVR